jgi:tetratricopeptide (TPR) repeat protein
MKPTLTNLNRLIKRQTFNHPKEAEDFFERMSKFSLDDLPKVELTLEEQAQDLVYEAYDFVPAKAKKNIEKALELDPECIEAYEYLATTEKTTEIAMVFCEKGIAIGRKKFGGKFLKDFKGMFWAHHETRPFLRCLYKKAEWLIAKNKLIEAIAIMEEILERNKSDNLGVRFLLMPALMMRGEIEKFQKYNKMFSENTHPSTIF